MAGLVFFRPEPPFFDWLVKYVGDRPVFDVGCGTGALVTQLWNRRFKACGVEISYDRIDDVEVQRKTLIQDARTCKMLREHVGVALFCRPDHSGWVEAAVHNLHPESVALYISKPGNELTDLPGFSLTRLKVPGVEETVWEVNKPYPTLSVESQHRLALAVLLKDMF